MKIIVVIGGIGSGKSTVSKRFIQQGSAFIDLDVVGHDVLRLPEVIDDMVAAFGADILDADGQVNRRALARKAFATPEATATLNGISHPRLIAEAKRRLQAYADEGKAACVIEISPYDGPQGTFGVFTDMADATVAVVAPLELRVQRAVARGNDEQDVRNRIARQVSDDQRRAWADYVIENDSDLDTLYRRIDEVWHRIVSA
ncbi:MAG: dephospho-CoA kinase [Eggerthellaceae bacterium]